MNLYSYTYMYNQEDSADQENSLWGKFSFDVPLSLDKSGDTDQGWKIKGLASTEDKDLQDEILKQKGIDISPIKKGNGWINYNHSNEPEDMVGKLDDAYHTPDGLMIEGYLFKKHARARALYQIMKSLDDKDLHAIKLSVEGKINKRSPKNRNVVESATVGKVAITFDPINPNTYVELCKALVRKKPEDKMKQENDTLDIADLVETISKADDNGESALHYHALKYAFHTDQINKLKQVKEPESLVEHHNELTHHLQQFNMHRDALVNTASKISGGMKKSMEAQDRDITHTKLKIDDNEGHFNDPGNSAGNAESVNVKSHDHGLDEPRKGYSGKTSPETPNVHQLLLQLSEKLDRLLSHEHREEVRDTADLKRSAETMIRGLLKKSIKQKLDSGELTL